MIKNKRGCTNNQFLGMGNGIAVQSYTHLIDCSRILWTSYTGVWKN